MPNPYFKFKQFTVYHDRCAMKVGTDGVLLGAWTNAGNVKNTLDIGAGSGLIALMLAQQNRDMLIDAIDIDNNAVEQAGENVMRSPFSSQIRCFNISLQEYALNCDRKYDLIVSNPPYFDQSLKSPDENRSIARHADSLPADELIKLSSKLLAFDGRLSVIYPFGYKDFLLQQNSLFVSRMTNVYPVQGSLPKRVLIEFSKQRSSLEETDLLIEKKRHVYSDEFVSLAKDYYLKL
ncbi:MAG: methyltransferase [Prevotella sp.]|jgi:tRNA1Val (adenine37-N6)-methyltransferase|nr:methyltransferase [Prevotella sp.]